MQMCQFKPESALTDKLPHSIAMVKLTISKAFSVDVISSSELTIMPHGSGGSLN